MKTLYTFRVLFIFLLLVACSGGGSKEKKSNASAATSSSSSSTIPVGLDARPDNTTCLAPAAVSTGNQSQITWEPAFASLPAISAPSSLFQLPDNDQHWYVMRQAGYIVRFDNSPTANQFTQVLDINERVDYGNNSWSELGLLGFAIHPNFASNRYVFLYYTARSPANAVQTRITRYTVNTDGTFNRDSEKTIMNFDRPFSNHVGGQMAFDKDGYLLISSGDGGSQNDPQENGQKLTSLLGKIIRIDVNNITVDQEYTIPSDNPFVGQTDKRAEIFAYGFRNPWRFSIDSINNELWVGDVGQETWEEVNLVTRGGNYGWGDMEGNGCLVSVRPNCSTAGKITPTHAINHSTGACSVIGGFAYRGTQYPAVYGRYFFTDYCEHTMRSLTRNLDGSVQMNAHNVLESSVVSFGQDNQGELYAVAQGDAGKQIYRMTVTNSGKTPGIMANLLSQTGCVQTTNPQQAASGMIPYEVQMPFWSDSATKTRFLSLPNNSTINLDSVGDFYFPVGSVLMKNFILNDRYIETRLFAHGELGWQGFSYEWNDEQTEATLLADQKDKTVEGVVWHYPSRGECLTCHTRAAGFSLGTEALQLNRDFLYPSTQRNFNQLLTLEGIGLFSAPLSDSHKQKKLAQLQDAQQSLQERARSYLHANCSYCHRPEGQTTVSIDLRYTTPLSATGICDQVPTVGALGITDARIVAPSEPLRSVLLKRLQITTSDQMPPKPGRSTVDTAGAQLISDWITSLQNCL
jgi:uncharacterized repeat protein (TIGR03806 family)